MKSYSNTPARHSDPHSGIEILQLVPDAAMSILPSYDWPSITPDNRYVIVRCEFGDAAGRPSGFYRVATDGSEIAYLAPMGIHPRLTLDGKCLYTLHTDDTVLHRTDVLTGAREDICDLEPLLPGGYQWVQMRLSPCSNHLFFMLRKPDITPIRVDLATGEAVRLEIEGMLWACAADAPRMIVVRMLGADTSRKYDYMSYRLMEGEVARTLWSLDVDGGDDRMICVDQYSHATMLGGTSRVQGCGKSGDRSISIEEEGCERRTVCEGPYFWHSGASFDAEWIAADTNWPDYGIQLAHVPTGNFRYLCYSGSSLSTGLAHAHPSLSCDGSIALFRSDRTGAIQAYLVHIPEVFRESVKAGVIPDSVPVFPRAKKPA